MVVAEHKREKDRAAIRARFKREKLAKRNQTIHQRETLDALYAKACRATTLTMLHSVRSDKLTNDLNEKNYLDFIRIVDRLLDSY